MQSFFQSHGILTLLIVLPLLGAVAAYLSGERNARHVALWVGVAEFILSVPLFFYYRPGTSCGIGGPQTGMSNCIDAPWFPDWGIRYQLGMDGISLFMVLLTTLLLPLMVLGSWTYIRERERGFYASLLALTSGVVGVFVALDMFLFYVFWEMMLIPMYFLIGIWGGRERVYAAVKFFLYTAVGSLLMLVAILYLWHKAQAAGGAPTFSYFDFLRLQLTGREQFMLFMAFALAFAVKVPMFPFHTWLPHAHVQAPTAGSVILAGVLLKMGTYGFIRFALPLFPDAASDSRTVTWAMVLGLVGILYAAMVAAVQPNAKKLVAYTSVAHLGFVILGIFAFNLIGLQGALLVMIGHGLSTPMLFFLLGMLYERRHSYEIEDFGGLAASLPVFATLLVFAAMASIGLPGTAGFASEFLVLVGAFLSRPWMALVAALGVIFAAYYMLPMVQRMLFNPLSKRENRGLPDLNAREIGLLAPLVVLIILLGFYPRPVLDRMEPAAARVLELSQASRLAPELPAPPVAAAPDNR
ncbi:MAG TPA: NADH-quinone oxidoreductase subunit M [Longimicrobium sp.]|jgi:NADH-quinone oxidoreductase subunit M|uniref:complex I subunit 4 family protein n=1 Tax=Longimicrobium sp. TaxID=2029185 RepID=UPI002EDB82A0